eukprot:3714652-Rhodomonas_salina.1
MEHGLGGLVERKDADGALDDFERAQLCGRGCRVREQKHFLRHARRQSRPRRNDVRLEPRVGDGGLERVELALLQAQEKLRLRQLVPHLRHRLRRVRLHAPHGPRRRPQRRHAPRVLAQERAPRRTRALRRVGVPFQELRRLGSRTLADILVELGGNARDLAAAVAWQHDREDGAVVVALGARVEPDRAAHGRHEAADNGEPEPGAAGAALHLAERFPDLRELVGWNALAGVGDGDLDLRARSVHARADLDEARGRELDRVPDQ